MRTADGLPSALVYAGFSLGVLPAQKLAQTRAGAQLFLYPGSQHYFADSSLPSYDPAAAALLTTRVLDFLRTR